jgi:RNA polymerase sigma-B factor
MPTRDLAGLDERALLGIAGSPPGSEQRAAACELLVTRYRWLVQSCVRRYLHSPEPTEDLMQVGYVGLVKAIGNFDPAICGSLAAYARPCISGELKRHFRDKRWQVHVKRSVKELVLQARDATWQLTQELGRTPAESDIARYLGVSANELGTPGKRNWPFSRPRWTRRWPASRPTRAPWPTSSASQTCG